MGGARVSLARNSVATESESGQKFLPPNPLPFCPPERSVWRAKRAVNSVQNRFGFRQTNALGYRLFMGYVIQCLRYWTESHLLNNRISMSPKINGSLMVSVCVSALFLSPLVTSAQSLAAPTLTLAVSKTSIVANAKPAYNDLPTISWSSTNATSCSASGTGWSGAVALAGNQKVNPPVTTTYTMTCAGAGGSSQSSVTLTVMPAGTTQVASVIGAFDQMTNNATAQTQAGFKHTWSRNLRVGSSYTNDVYALQTALTLEGVYATEITGGFYNKTLAGVKQFQQKYGIDSTGFVGSLTRAQLNRLYGN